MRSHFKTQIAPSSPPRIALTAWTRVLETGVIGPSPMATVGTDYVDCVQRAGGVALMLPVDDPAVVPTLLNGIHGVVLIGGNDVDPASYGRQGDGRSHNIDANADAFETSVARHAVRLGIPILAICRGLQILNVALGGTLHEDVEDVTDQPHRASGNDAAEILGLRHHVHVEAGSRIGSLYGANLEVNSIHHQAIAQLAPGLEVTARSHDGLVEAVEMAAAGPCVLGVQWHPEKTSNGQVLFDYLVSHAVGLAGRLDQQSSEAIAVRN